MPEPGWLDAYREAFELDPRVGAAFGPHLPFPDTSPMIARELTEFFAGFSPNGAPALHRGGDLTFLSNVNACYLRECWAELRFPDIEYSEDQAFGRAMLEAGWVKVVPPRRGGPPRPRLRRRRVHEALLRRVPRPARGERPRGAAAAATRPLARWHGDVRWMRERGMSPAERGALDRALDRPSGRPPGGLGARLACASRCRRACSGGCRSRGAAREGGAVRPAPARPRCGGLSRAASRTSRGSAATARRRSTRPSRECPSARCTWRW